jgi:hypothetical protein
MATLSRTLRSVSASVLFSGVAAIAQSDVPPPPSPDRATLEFRVAAAASGTPMTSPGGVVRLSLSITPENDVELAIAKPTSGNTPSETVRLAGLGGPTLVWVNGPGNPLGFSAAFVVIDQRSRTTFDDRAARSVHWPINGWPENAGATLHAGAQSDEVNPDLRRLVEGWLGAQTRAVTPAVLAKYLAARAMTHARADLEPLLALDGADSAIVGLRSRGVGEFARVGSGSEFDLLRAYTAALRLAGIPARLATGLRAEATGDAALHAWVEFFLYDERAQSGQWIAVDLLAQRRLAHEPPPVADPWRYFGANSATLLPFFIGIPQPTSRDASILAPWRVDCEPPCVPLRVTARVVPTTPNDSKVAQR